MAGLQIAAVGAAAILALVLGVAAFEVLEAVSLGILWLIFSAAVWLFERLGVKSLESLDKRGRSSMIS